MGDVLRKGERWLADMQSEHASQPVVYDRRGVSNVSISATIGRSEFNITDAGGVSVQVETQDFIVFASLLKLDGSPIEPRPGDRVVWNGQIFQVSSPGADLPHWRWAEPTRIRYRIHTKYVADVP